MAVKYAVANGNWSAGATWNDGVVPADGDDVYANNYEIIMNVSTINIGSINTTEYPDYNIARGGQFIFNTTRILQAERTCDLRYSSGASITYNGSNVDCYFTAPLIKSNGVAVFSHTNGNSRGWNVNGDIEIDNPNTYLAYAGAGGSRHLLNINGNINGAFVYSLFSNSNTGGWNITINGNVLGGHEDFTTNLGVNNITINGHKHYTLNEYDKFVKGRFVINGNITYEANNEKAGLDLAYTSIQNPSTFTWKDVTSPRANHFVVITDIELNNSLQYPPEDKVKEGTEYAWGVMTGEWIPDYPQEENVKMGVSYADGELVGTYDFNQYLPPESVVLKDYEYGDSDDRKIGTMVQEVNVEVGCVTPEDVRKDVPLVGMGVVGSLVVPSVDDVREGVIFDNGSVGTLIVQGGGDRLRIADFGYYTRSTSITYIVDLTESDKPAFADCEEIVLRSLFPTLDLNNIPDKFFDDLFIQFLRYRLLVEYYRGTSINSKFTPSEPTTEIVNYANTKCEYWLNTANLFLQLWGEKYPNSVKKDRILL